MRGDDKKAAIAAYKKRESPIGIYAVRCAATNEIWVGQSPNLDAIQNRLIFTLDMGTHPVARLQAAWSQHGAGRLSFDVLERLDREETPYIQKALLKERCVFWREKLAAQVI